MTDFFKVTPTDEITGVVQKVEDFAGKYGPSYNITVDPGDGYPKVVTEKKEKVDGLVLKLGLNRDTMIGRTLRFWKRPLEDDPSKGYLNIDLIDAPRVMGPPTTGPQKPMPVSEDPDEKETRIKAQAKSDLDWAWNTAYTVMSPKINGMDLGNDPLVVQALQAAAVGLMIRLEHARRER